MRNLFTTTFTAFILSIVPFAAQAERINTAFQVATIGSLSQGVFDGDVTFAQLAKHGDFGLGTFKDLDGEMVALNGKYYRIASTGKVAEVNMQDAVPFAQVTMFNPMRIIPLQKLTNYKTLASKLSHEFTNKNIPYAIRIDGEFNYIKLRSLRKQHKPYPLLEKAAKKQAVFKLRHVKGTIVGFWFPKYWAGIAVPGLHLHFITDKRDIGGHVLELNLAKGKLSLENIHHVQVYMPRTRLFARANLSSNDIHESIKRAEGGV